MLGYKEMIRKYKINSLVETDNIIERQRMIKDREEISNIQKACEITDNRNAGISVCIFQIIN